jgi:hypothetical protein
MHMVRPATKQLAQALIDTVSAADASGQTASKTSKGKKRQLSAQSSQDKMDDSAVTEALKMFS